MFALKRIFSVEQLSLSKYAQLLKHLQRLLFSGKIIFGLICKDIKESGKEKSLGSI